MMKVFYTPHFRRSLRKLSKEVQEKFAKQLDFLLKDISHPSLEVKKYDRARDIWQARVDIDVRFYFKIGQNNCLLLEIKHHLK